MFLLGTKTFDLRLFQVAVDFDWLRFASGATATDVHVGTAFVEHLGTSREGPRRVAIIDMYVDAHVVPVERDATSFLRREALRMQIDFVSLAGVGLANGWSLGLSGGLGLFAPAHLYDVTALPPPGQPSPDRGPQLIMPTLLVDISHRLSARPFVPAWSPLVGRFTEPVGAGFSLGAGTFQRLDPTGSAVDVGARSWPRRGSIWGTLRTSA